MIAKAAWLILALGGIAYTIFGANQLYNILQKSDPGTAGGGSMIAAGVVPVCLGLIATIVGIQRAFGKPKAEPSENDSDESP